MRGEDIYEDGVVVTAADGKATVAVQKSGSCEECTAKIFCASGDENKNTVDVLDPYGVHVGDEVRIVIRGESLFAAGFLLYGIPLVLIIGGILAGMYLFDVGIGPRELSSFIVGILLAGVYYLALFVNGNTRTLSSLMPNIVFVRK